MKASDIQEIDFDFGFTAVDEEELETVQQATAQVEATSGEVQTLKDKLVLLRKSIEPLLKNLEANPEKAYIHWPDRTSKVKAFRTKLDSIQKL
jgi:uncharacterized protein (DUF342 family)